jgi:hypothetical protein
MNRREPRETESVSSDEADETRTKTGGLHTQSGVQDTHPATGMVGEDPKRKKTFYASMQRIQRKKTLQNFSTQKR